MGKTVVYGCETERGMATIRLLTAEHFGEWMKLSLAIPCLIAFFALLNASLLHIDRIPEGLGYFIVKRSTPSVKPMG